MCISQESTAKTPPAEASIPGHNTIVLNGPTTVVLAGQQRPDAVGLVSILEAMDPEDIEKEAMNRLEWGSTTTLTQNVLLVIRERVLASES